MPSCGLMKCVALTAIVLLNGVATDLRNVAKAQEQPQSRVPSDKSETWDLVYSQPNRQATATLTIHRTADGGLAAHWVSEPGTSKISQVKHEGNQLSFVRTLELRRGTFVTTFVGKFEGNRLTGVLKGNDFGEQKVSGVRQSQRAEGERDRLAAANSSRSNLAESAAFEGKPNIIFIMADDLGQYDLGCTGQKHILTPRLDRMAAEGCFFDQCYTGAAVCAPSRCALMTGMHMGHARVRNNSSKTGGVPPQGRVPLREEDVTVAEVLKSAGYTNGITGKWGLGEPNTTGVPNRQGFDEWLGLLNQRHAHTYYPEYFWRNEEFQIAWGNMGGYEGQWIHDDFTKFALEFINENKAGPFFLYVPYTVPHGKYEIPNDEPYSDKPWSEDAKNYAAMVTRLDSDVGKILDLLGDLGIDERTIVFFCSDNGATFTREPFFSAGPLRGKKGNLYEGGIRTPMIVRWPGMISAGRTSSQPWAFWDFLPTAAELAGVKSPEGIDGISMAGEILGKPQKAHEFLYWETPSGGYSQAVRWNDWKGIRTSWGAPVELYNLAEDLGEQKNLADRHPDIVKRIEDYMKASHVESDLYPTPDK